MCAPRLLRLARLVALAAVAAGRAVANADAAAPLSGSGASGVAAADAVAEPRQLHVGRAFPGLEDGLVRMHGVEWFSHIILGIGALFYVLAGAPLSLDGCTNFGQVAAMDSELKDAGVDSKAKVYQALERCEDPVVKKIAFWAVVMMRSWGFFQVTLGLAFWCVIFTVPVAARAPFHFTNAFLQLGEAFFLELQLMGGGGCGKDPITAMGGGPAASTNQVAVADAGGDGRKPFDVDRKVFRGGFIGHIVLGLCSLLAGVLTIVAGLP